MNLNEKIISGEPLRDLEIIDAHMHLNTPPFYVPDPGPGGVLKTMNRYGIERGIVSPNLAITSDMVKGNDEILELITVNDRLMAYCTINPHFIDRVTSELQRCFSRGAVAVKIHPSVHRISVTDRKYYPVYEYAEEQNVPVLSHTWAGEPGFSPSDFLKVLKDFPKLTVLMGHAGGTFDGMKESIDVIRKHPLNLFADLTGSYQYLRRVELLCAGAGADNVIFGSDSPWIDPGFALGPVLSAEISDEDKRKILAGNIKRILGITQT